MPSNTAAHLSHLTLLHIIYHLSHCCLFITSHTAHHLSHLTQLLIYHISRCCSFVTYFACDYVRKGWVQPPPPPLLRALLSHSYATGSRPVSQTINYEVTSAVHLLYQAGPNILNEPQASFDQQQSCSTETQQWTAHDEFSSRWDFQHYSTLLQSVMVSLGLSRDVF